MVQKYLMHHFGKPVSLNFLVVVVVLLLVEDDKLFRAAYSPPLLDFYNLFTGIEKGLLLVNADKKVSMSKLFNIKKYSSKYKAYNFIFVFKYEFSKGLLLVYTLYSFLEFFSFRVLILLSSFSRSMDTGMEKLFAVLCHMTKVIKIIVTYTKSNNTSVKFFAPLDVWSN